MFTSSTKREIRHFHVVVVEWRQRNVQKSELHVQSCCLTNLNLLLFRRPRCRCRCRCRCLTSLTQEHNCFYFIGYPMLFCFVCTKDWGFLLNQVANNTAFDWRQTKNKTFCLWAVFEGSARAIGVIKIKHENKSVATYTHVREKMLKNNFSQPTTSNIAIELVLQECYKTSCTILWPFHSHF